MTYVPDTSEFMSRVSEWIDHQNSLQRMSVLLIFQYYAHVFAYEWQGLKYSYEFI